MHILTGCNLFQPISATTLLQEQRNTAATSFERSAKHSKAREQRRHRVEYAHQEEESRDDLCVGCGLKALTGKMLCKVCLLEAATDKEAEKAEMVRIIKQTVKESLQDLTTTTSQPGESGVSLTAAQRPRDPSPGSSSGEESQQVDTISFRYSSVQPLVKEVREALEWEEEITQPTKTRRYYPQLKVSCFLLLKR